MISISSQIEDSGTFSGKEAETLSIETINSAFKILDEARVGKDPFVAPIKCLFHNCSDHQLEQYFGKKKEEVSPMNTIYGLPICLKKFVPVNEIWMIDNAGKVVKKFVVK